MPHFLVRLDPPAIYITAAGLGPDVYPSIKMARAALDDGVTALIAAEGRHTGAKIASLLLDHAERKKALRLARKAALKVREADLPTEPSAPSVAASSAPHPAEATQAPAEAEGQLAPLTETLTAIRGELDAAGVEITLGDVLPTEFPLRDSPRSMTGEDVRLFDGALASSVTIIDGEPNGSDAPIADTVAEIGRQVRDGVTGGGAA